mgnify:FL=1
MLWLPIALLLISGEGFILTSWEIAITLAIIVGATFLTRIISFLIFPPHKPLPPFIAFLGKALPIAMMGLLVVLALKDTNLMAYPYGLPEIIASLGTIAIHLLWRKLILSVVGGMAIYMALVQLVF